jgi:hypothetical protein
VTIYLADYAVYQAGVSLSSLKSAGYTIINFKISHGLTRKSVAENLPALIAEARKLGLEVCTFHWLDKSATGTAQADYAFSRMTANGLTGAGFGHVCDCESDATEKIYRDYMSRMKSKLGRDVGLYTGDWWWQPRGWTGATYSPYLHAAPNQGYLSAGYPGDTSTHWKAGYGGWPNLSIMQYRVGKVAGVPVSQSAIRDPAVWSALTGGEPMAWVLIPAAKSLFAEFNELAPKRDKSSDGSVGDLSHQQGVSDHNPDETGATGGSSDSDKSNEVHAIDVDNSGPWPDGKDMEWSVQTILGRCRSGAEKRLKYVIYNRRIWSGSGGWKQTAYSGANPHDHHAHFSFKYGSGPAPGNPEQITSPWGLLAPPPGGDEDDMKEEDFARIEESVRRAMREEWWGALHALRHDEAYEAASPSQQRIWRQNRDVLRGVMGIPTAEAQRVDAMKTLGDLETAVASGDEGRAKAVALLEELKGQFATPSPMEAEGGEPAADDDGDEVS